MAGLPDEGGQEEGQGKHGRRLAQEGEHLRLAGGAGGEGRRHGERAGDNGAGRPQEVQDNKIILLQSIELVSCFESRV